MLNEYLQSGLKAAKGVYKSAKYQMEGLSEIEIKTRECTNSDPWGAHGKDLAVLARATHNREEMYLIMKTLWLRLEEREEKWRHCYKALNVIEYLVAHGHESCVKELKQNVRSIEYLDTFKFKDSSGRDQGINVRQKSATLAALLRDDERIAEAREKARRNRGKYSGISADDVRSGSYNRQDRGGSSYSDRDGDRYASGDGYGDDRASRDRDDYASRDRRESSRDRDGGDREFRAFSAAPAPAARAAPARGPAPPPFQADFGDFEDDTPAAPSASGYVPKVVLSPAPSAAPARVVALAPPPGTGAVPGSARTAAGAGGLDELFAGMATSPAPAPAAAPAPAPADPFGDMFGAPAAPPAASSHAAPTPAAAVQASTPDLFSLDVPAAAPPPAMGGGGGLGAFGPAAPPQMDLDQLYAAPPQMPARMGGMMGGVPQMQQVPGFGAQQGMMGGAYAQQQNAMQRGGFGMQQSGMTAPMGGVPMGGMPMGGMPMGGMPMGGFGAGAGATGSPGNANGGGGSLI